MARFAMDKMASKLLGEMTRKLLAKMARMLARTLYKKIGMRSTDNVSSDDLDLCSSDGGIQQLQVLIKELNAKEDKVEDELSTRACLPQKCTSSNNHIINNFFLQYENITSELLNVLRKVRDKIQRDINFKRK
ncbi:uncharacterized protein LOC111406694 [Olea europaea var. sylvestris]|uniref:uncharacterized protein LOC111406694 n=1 Tax=Olea europaea var. sylvestris TaxID=158386 RepID=UPI000C1CFF6E|nr:uncharacterized protein LOC111406694 [Olea europaea var. sylvestris]